MLNCYLPNAGVYGVKFLLAFYVLYKLSDDARIEVNVVVR